MTAWTLLLTCPHCGADIDWDRDHRQHEHRLVAVGRCEPCKAELAVTVKLETIVRRPPAVVNERARAYRARKREMSSA